jgi:hypothetical protein
MSLLLPPDATTQPASASRPDPANALDDERTKRDQWYEKRKSQYTQRLPYLLFLPGVLGTRIKDCGDRGSNRPETDCSVIWGDISRAFSSSVDLFYDANNTYRPALLDGAGPLTFYGAITNYFDKINLDKKLLVNFPYDWRRSIDHNALDLHDKTCLLSDSSDEDIHVNIVAQSMGGLLFRH